MGCGFSLRSQGISGKSGYTKVPTEDAEGHALKGGCDENVVHAPVEDGGGEQKRAVVDVITHVQASVSDALAQMFSPAPSERAGSEQAPSPAVVPPTSAAVSDRQNGKQGEDGAVEATATLLQYPVPESVGPVLDCVVSCLRSLSGPMMFVVSYAALAAGEIQALYERLPKNVVRIIFGLGLCFFGGIYYASIAAIEAVRNMGGPEMMEHLRVCWTEGAVMVEAVSLDDPDSQGASTEGLKRNAREVMQHKIKVAMVAVKEPDRLQKALFNLLNICLSVIATLQFNFAGIVAIALGLAETVILPATRILGPSLAGLLGHDLKHWVPMMIETVIKVSAIVVACYVQAVLSAIYTGIRGGRMVATGLLNIATRKGWIEHLPDSWIEKPFDPDKSSIDELIAFPLAVVGVGMQVCHGFTLDFPWNLVLLPLSLLESLLRFLVMWSSM